MYTRKSNSQVGMQVPERFGRIRLCEVFEDSPYRVWKIEDTNFHVDVQQSAFELIDHLTSSHGIKLVCLEGAVGSLPVAHLKRALRPGEGALLRRDFWQRHIGASVYLAMSSNRALELYGVDDDEPYQRNTQALQDVFHRVDACEHAFKVLIQHLDRAKRSLYNAEQLALDRASVAYQDREYQLGALLAMLSRHHDEIATTFPNIRHSWATQKVERALNRLEIRHDAERLLEHVYRCLDSPSVEISLFDRVVRAELKVSDGHPADASVMSSAERLVTYRGFVSRVREQLTEFQRAVKQGDPAGHDIYGALIELAGLCRLDLRRYENLLAYVHYVSQAHRISSSNLMLEVNTAVDIVRARVLRTDDEHRALESVDRAVRALRKRCRISATPQDEERFLREFGPLTMSELCKRVAIAGGPVEHLDTIDLATVDTAMAAARQFYQMAPLRGRMLAENTLLQMLRRGVTDVVLVSGGFLTEFILRVFRRERISYAVVMPHAKPSPMTFEIYARNFNRGKAGSFFAELGRRVASEPT